MRKLTVENFSVIKNAELEFGKITVLIGPQSSGKSLLCKLAYFLGKELFDLAVSSLQDGLSWDIYGREATKAFFARFPSPYTHAHGRLETKVEFESFNYNVSINWEVNPLAVTFNFSEEFETAYRQLFATLFDSTPSASGAFFPGGISSSRRQEDTWIGLNTVLADSKANPVLDGVLYVPAGRAFFTNLSKGSAILQNLGLDSITREFAAQIQWDSRGREGMFASRRDVTDEVTRAMTDIARGFVIMDSGVPRFIASDGRKLPLEVLSTGTQELIPLFNIFERLMFTREHLVEYAKATFNPPQYQQVVTSRPLLYLEEPESNVFPETQHDLVKLFAWLASDTVLDFAWVITTHSPYVLSSFNNLLEAWQVGHMDEERGKAVREVIAEKYWIKPEEFRAYAIEDGILKSIVAEDTKLISSNYLDSVSETIGSEFDELLRLGYVEA